MSRFLRNFEGSKLGKFLIKKECTSFLILAVSGYFREIFEEYVFSTKSFIDFGFLIFFFAKFSALGLEGLVSYKTVSYIPVSYKTCMTTFYEPSLLDYTHFL